MMEQVDSAFEEHNEVISMIYDEMDSMQSELLILRTRIKELEAQNSEQRKIINNHDNNDIILSKLMEVNSNRNKTLLTMLWALSTSESVVDKLAANETFISLIDEFLHTEVLQEVIKPVLGIVANICFHKAPRKKVGLYLALSILNVDVGEKNQKVLSTVIMNLTLESEISLNFVNSGIFFDKINELMKSKECFSYAERALTNVFTVLVKNERVNEFIDELVNIAKLYPINKELKRQIGSIASGLE